MVMMNVCFNLVGVMNMSVVVVVVHVVVDLIAVSILGPGNIRYLIN
jgi:hypothetical protein